MFKLSSNQISNARSFQGSADFLFCLEKSKIKQLSPLWIQDQKNSTHKVNKTKNLLGRGFLGKLEQNWVCLKAKTWFISQLVVAVLTELLKSSYLHFES